MYISQYNQNDIQNYIFSLKSKADYQPNHEINIDLKFQNNQLIEIETSRQFQIRHFN